MLVGLMGGTKVEVDIGLVLRKRFHIIDSVMCSQPLSKKIAITQHCRERWLPLMVQGAIRPMADHPFPLAEAAVAHRYMEENRNTGKIMLAVD